MKKILLFVVVLCLLPACKSIDNNPDLSESTTHLFVGDYDSQLNMELSLSAFPGIKLPHTDSVAFSIVELGFNRVRLVYSDDTTMDATVSGNTMILDSDSTLYTFEGVEIKGIATGTGVLKENVLTINGQFSGDIIGTIDIFLAPVVLDGTCTGTTVTVATKKIAPIGAIF